LTLLEWRSGKIYLKIGSLIKIYKIEIGIHDMAFAKTVIDIYSYDLF